MLNGSQSAVVTESLDPTYDTNELGAPIALDLVGMDLSFAEARQLTVIGWFRAPPDLRTVTNNIADPAWVTHLFEAVSDHVDIVEMVGHSCDNRLSFVLDDLVVNAARIAPGPVPAPPRLLSGALAGLGLVRCCAG